MAKYWIRFFCLILLTASISEAGTIFGDTIWAKSKYKGLPDSTRASHLADSAKDAGMLDGLHASSFSLSSHIHDDRYYTETELTNYSIYLNLAGLNLKNTAYGMWDGVSIINNYTGWVSGYGPALRFGGAGDGGNRDMGRIAARWSYNNNGGYTYLDFQVRDNETLGSKMRLFDDGSLVLYNGVGWNTVWDAGNFIPATKSDTSTTNIHFTNYSATSTVYGWSGTPSKDIRVLRVGKNVTVYFAISGTSNNIFTAFTVPDSVNSDLTFTDAPCRVRDDGTYLPNPGFAEITYNLIEIRKDWTGDFLKDTGAKMVAGTITYTAK